jgi:flagella basal body P-ring formation protein FlgA
MKLSDIAAINVENEHINTEILGNIVVATLVHVNQPLNIKADKLKRLIALEEPAVRNKIHLTGAASVTVVLPGVDFPMNEVLDSAKSFLSAELNKQSSPFEILDARATRHLSQIPKGRLELSPRFSGKFTIAKQIDVLVDVYVNDNRFDSIPVSVTINLTEQVYRMTRAAARGEILKSGDYQLTAMPIDRSTRVAALLAPGADFTALRLRRSIKANSILYRDDFEITPLVTRNQKVSAEFRTGGIIVENTAIAQSDGRLGDVIKVASSDSASIYYAKVTAKGHVEVK